MEATSEQDGGGSGAGDYEALMAALMANRQLLEAKVGINNAMFAASDMATSQLGDSFVVGECQGQKTIDGKQMPLIKEFPGKVILFCEVPPPEGGETPFVPSFRVTERALEEFPEMVEELDAKGLRYTFTAPSNNNTGSMRGRGWEDAFGTSDKSEAETRAKALGMGVEWLEDGGVKTILGPRTLTRVFPGRKGRRMWFNTLVGMHGKDLSSATAADGTEIPASFVQRCEEIIEEESIQFRWRKGDILILDNLATLHGRRPSLPPRRVLVATCK
ncbi:clavaminate synthase-like protein At3g21360 [Triticum dicoccoides]|uniref:clavaminate synthase-like protein At3g21360 n=1 Tax=Triticum dicoccoides TaxID=85692 RepID=UPI00188F3B62|nr:clavaminate synthase-like protein At3g21360 [Triticum dicoccoides]